MAALTFVSKISNGLAGVIIGWAIQLGKYDAAAAVQTSSAVMALKVCFSYLPLLFCVLGVILMLFYDLDKIFPQIQADLQARRTGEK